MAITLDSLLKKIVDRLDHSMESEHFIVRYTLRNPIVGPGAGAWGVRDPALVPLILGSLERLYATMTGLPHHRKPPIVPPQTGKTPVYVFELTALGPGFGSPFTFADTSGIPFICLPARSFEAAMHFAHQRAAVEAVHEATHVFNAVERPFLDGTISQPWRWLNEGMAVCMETVVLPGCSDCLRYWLDWLDIPQMPLDHQDGSYQASMFVKYLENTEGHGFVSDVWKKAAPNDMPLEAIARALDARNKVFASATCKDVFASGYCMDSYFLLDPSSGCFSPELFARFTGRAAAAAFRIQKGQQAKYKNRLDHLACHYYPIRVDRTVSREEITLTSELTVGTPVLKGEITTVTQDMRRGEVVALEPPSESGTANNTVRATVTVPSDLDHFVLVVTNCGVTGAADNPPPYNDDRQEYEITILAN
jgi:hypothetical protein